MSPPLARPAALFVVMFVVSRPMGGAVRRCDYSARLRRCGRESAGAPLTSASRRHLQAPLAMASSRHASDAASRPDSHHRDCRRDQRHGCRSHPSCSAENRHAGLGARRHQDPRPRRKPISTSSRSSWPRPKPARSRSRAARPIMMLSDWLWVARERSLGDGLVFYPSSSTLGAVMVPAQSADPGASPISRARSSRSPAARSTRAGCCCRRWRAAPASISGSRPRSSMARRRCCREKALQGETDATLTFWNFCADLEGKGHKARDRHGRRHERPRRQRAGRHRRLYLRRRLGGAQPIGGRPLPRGRPPGQGDSGDLGGRMAAARPAHRRRPMRARSRSIASATARASRAARSPTRRPTRRALYRVLAEIGGAELVGPARELDAGTFYRPAAGD